MKDCFNVMEKFVTYTLFHRLPHKHADCGRKCLSVFRNNVIGTKTTLSAAKKSGVSDL